jgi:PEGA domain-containing protein
MRHATQTILWTAALLAPFAAFCQTQTAALKPPQSAHGKKSDDPFMSGPPFSFDQVLRLLGEDAIPLHRRQQAIRSRGVDFAWTQDRIDKLKAAGASADTIDAIKSKAKMVAAAPTPPPKPPPTGGISVTCAPLECDVIVKGSPRGSTQNGTMELTQLAPGKWTIDLQKAGYIASQSVVTVEADKLIPVSATLEPTRATQEGFGSSLFGKVVEALGGVDGVRVLSSVQATGSVTILTADGKSVRWSLMMRNRPDRALFQARGGGGILHEVAFLGSEYRASKNLKGPDALELPTDFGFVRDYQLAALMTKLSDPQFKLWSLHPVPVSGEEYSLFAESGTEKYAIALDSESRPQRIKITTATGVGSGLIIYGDYYKKEKASYPKTLQIKSEGRQQGIDVRFDSVDLSPNLTDLDYKLKGKPLMRLDD